jgi:hypothetical protein
MRADSLTGRIICALARTPEPALKSKRRGIHGDSTGGHVVAALARTPEPHSIREAPTSTPPASGEDKAPAGLQGDQATDPASYLARELIEMRMTARDLMRALSTAFNLNHSLSEKTGIIFSVEVVSGAAGLLAQALGVVYDLARALDEAGTSEFRRESAAGGVFGLAETLAVAQKLREIRDGISALGRVIDGRGLSGTAPDASASEDLPQALGSLSLTIASIAELVRQSEVRDSGVPPDLARMADYADALTSATGQLREVARGAASLARELNRAATIAREVASARLNISGTAADLLDAAEKLAREFSAGELAEAQTSARAMSELLRTVDEIRAYAFTVSKAENLSDALDARNVIGRLDKFERSFNYVQAARSIDVPSSTDSLTRAVWQIKRLATAHIDASAADLRRLRVRDVEVLDGITWTHETIWPPAIRNAVRALSDEIRPGVYRVRDGDDRDPVDLAVVI